MLINILVNQVPIKRIDNSELCIAMDEGMSFMNNIYQFLIYHFVLQYMLLNKETNAIFFKLLSAFIKFEECLMFLPEPGFLPLRKGIRMTEKSQSFVDAIKPPQKSRIKSELGLRRCKEESYRPDS